MKLVSKILKRTDWYVTCNFGYYRNRGVLEYHCGTDYGTNNQKWNIYGIEQGVVLSCGTECGSKYIWVHYPRINKRLVHCHLDRIDVRAGQQLQEGTLLGCVGNTGSTTGIHLHLGMMPSGANCYEDPHAYEYSPPADMMNSDATVYGGPSTTIYAPIGSVVKNGTIEILKKENDFYYISYWTNSGLLKRGYVAVSQVNHNTSKAVEDITGSFRGNNNIVNPESTVYSGPNTATAVIGTVFEYEGITQFTLQENSLYFIEYSTPEGAKRGYIQGSKLIRKEGGLAIAPNGADVYYTYSLESKSGAVYANEYATVLQKNDQRSYIEYNTNNGRKRGYVTNGSLQFLNTDGVPALPNYSEEPHKATSPLTVYFGPTDKYSVVGSISEGEIVTRLSSPTLNADGYSFIQYSTTEVPKRGFVAALGLVPYVPSVVDPDNPDKPDPWVPNDKDGFVEKYVPLELLVDMANGRIVNDDRTAKTVAVEIDGMSKIYTDHQGTPFIDDSTDRWYVWFPEFLTDFNLREKYLPLETLVYITGGKIVNDDRTAKSVTIEIGGISKTYIGHQGTPFIDSSSNKWYVWYPDFITDFKLRYTTPEEFAKYIDEGLVTRDEIEYTNDGFAFC